MAASGQPQMKSAAANASAQDNLQGLPVRNKARNVDVVFLSQSCLFSTKNASSKGSKEESKQAGNCFIAC